jgi:ribosomal protein L37AE/L43A
MSEKQYYECEDCGGTLELRRSGVFVWGRCDHCGREVDFELPDIALNGQTTREQFA